MTAPSSFSSSSIAFISCCSGTSIELSVKYFSCSINPAICLCNEFSKSESAYMEFTVWTTAYSTAILGLHQVSLVILVLLLCFKTLKLVFQLLELHYLRTVKMLLTDHGIRFLHQSVFYFTLLSLTLLWPLRKA